MPQHRTELLGALGPNLDLVLVAVVVGQVERCETLVPDQAAEEGDGTLSLDVIPAEGKMHNRLVVTLKDSSELLQPGIREAILTDV